MYFIYYVQPQFKFTNYTEKLSPHPHVPFIFGLLKTNSDESSFST